MSRHKETIRLIEAAKDILAEGYPMTVRQVYYQLVSRQAIKNTRSSYNSVSKALVGARCEGLIPWAWIEDRLRRPRCVSMWDDLADFAESCSNAYRRDVWPAQPHYLEVWLEKDALSGIFEDLLDPFGITLNVGRGYDGWSSVWNASRRFEDLEVDAGAATILYFGDFDPSGEDMCRSLKERLASLGCEPEIIKCALVYEDIERYRLPPALAKRSDTRTPAFIAKHGDVSVELDALPVDVLRNRLKQEVEARMDLEALEAVKTREESERAELVNLLEGTA